MMPLEFDCTSCGKHYSVKSDLAGKRFRCKGCGESVVIPGGDEPLAGLLSVDDGSGQRGLRPEVLIPIPRAEVPRAAGGARKARPAPEKKKKARKTAGDRTTVKLLLWMVGALAVSFLVMGLATMVGRSSLFYPDRDELARTARRQIGMIERISSALTAAEDEESARAAAQRAVPLIKALTKNVKRSVARGANELDRDAVKKKYHGRAMAAVSKLVQQVVRVRSIPGAEDAVTATLKPPLDELAAASPDGEATPGLNYAFPPPPPPEAPEGEGPQADTAAPGP